MIQGQIRTPGLRRTATYSSRVRRHFNPSPPPSSSISPPLVLPSVRRERSAGFIFSDRCGMGFVSFVGRVLFASVFILSAYQEFTEFGDDGGPAARAFRPKFDRFTKHVSSHFGVPMPTFEMKQIIATTIALKGIGGFLFILSSPFGAFLLLLHLLFVSPIVYDFYNYDVEKLEFAQAFVKFTQNLALFGALLFFIGMKNSIPKRQAKKKVTKPKTN